MRLAIAVLATVSVALAQIRPSPTYAADTILNAASTLPDAYAPYTLLAIHGAFLSNSTIAVNLDGLKELPTLIPGSGTRVFIRNQLGGILSASPDQLLVLVPPDLVPGLANVQIMVDGRVGPAVSVRLRAASPALFLRAEGLAAATREDGSDVTPDAPAIPGELITLYATGLGPMKPNPVDLTVLRRQAPLTMAFQVLLDGAPLDPAAIEYAGSHPGLPGNYQIRCRLPSIEASQPEIRLLIDGQQSQEGIRIPVAQGAAAATEARSSRRK